MAYLVSMSVQAFYCDENPAFHPDAEGNLLPADAKPVSEELRLECQAAPRIDWSGEFPAPGGLLLEALVAQRLASINDECAAHIIAGFKSSALGAEHHYPAKLTDQVNLSASVLDSIVPGLPEDWTTPFWCAVDPAAQETWAFRPHTALQIQTVGRAGKAANLAALARKGLLEAQVAAATSPAEIAAITWEEDLPE